jgi:hypothetical protein
VAKGQIFSLELIFKTKDLTPIFAGRKKRQRLAILNLFPPTAPKENSG